MADLVQYPAGAPFPGVIGRTLDQSTPAWPSNPSPPPGTPNVVIWLLDDVGFGQLSPFGGGCEMPTLDRLAARGLRYTNFHTTALCSPTRGCLLTGRNHHTLGLSAITELALGFPSHNGSMPFEHGMLPEMLLAEGFNTFAVGKWHLTPTVETSPAGPFHRWPLGRGFERYYGFLAGDTDQWHPDLCEDNHFVEPPYRVEDGYHLNRDLADQSIRFIKDAHVAAPDKPFFLYFATGAGHAPHQVEPEWVEPYRGRFDTGWDAYREEVLARQVAGGIVPPDTVLSERDPDVPAWDSLSEDHRRMAARQMEVFAGFLTQTDHHFGRVIDFIDQIGELDNTIVLVLSDNGASAEGGEDGTFNEALFFNRVPERLEDNLEHFDGWGGPDTFNHYAWGWAWAGNTPFRRWKRETYRGGVADPLIVSWPAGIAGHGETRTQYAHAIDLAPTLLDVLGVEPPSTIRGVPQSELHGRSLAATLHDADAPEVRTTQYFEMFGHRSLYHEGWKAVCPWVGPSLKEAQEKGRTFGLADITAEMLDELDATDWELYDLRTDPSETRNLADQEPDRLRAMIERWYGEAERYGVLPIASANLLRLAGARPTVGGGRRHFDLYPGAARLPFSAAPRLVGRAHAITAHVDLSEGGAEGILLSQGNRHGGFALAMVDGHLLHLYNYLGLEEFIARTPEPVTPGPHVLRYEFEPTGPPVDLFHGKGIPARSKLYVDGTLTASIELPYTILITFGIMGMSCGYDTADSVAPDRWSAPFTFTGALHRVELDVSGELTVDDERELDRLMAQQ